jgi:hypothetical protein
LLALHAHKGQRFHEESGCRYSRANLSPWALSVARIPARWRRDWFSRSQQLTEAVGDFQPVTDAPSPCFTQPLSFTRPLQLWNSAIYLGDGNPGHIRQVWAPRYHADRG